MIQKIKTYINNKYPDRVSKCNAIGRLLRKLFGVSFVLFWILSGILLALSIYSNNGFSETLFKFLTYTFIIPVMSIMVVSLICSLFIIPIVWFIQCVDCIKNKKDNDEILRNLLFWILLALLSLYIYNDNKATDECMKECVLPDNSNYENCRDSTCDFPI